MSRLEQLIERAAKDLPEDWQITIQVEKGSGSVIVTRPVKSDVHMDDGESDIEEQFSYALELVRDEMEIIKQVKKEKLQAAILRRAQMQDPV